jgi:hypothetical protein
MACDRRTGTGAIAVGPELRSPAQEGEVLVSELLLPPAGAGDRSSTGAPFENFWR